MAPGLHIWWEWTYWEWVLEYWDVASPSSEALGEQVELWWDNPFRKGLGRGGHTSSSNYPPQER